ncbi:MAG: J domain-containing protein [Clostridiales bacterium]|jgi:hypothetical protein|nr:J domain-containing protein [Clostridiales bacterium]
MTHNELIKTAYATLGLDFGATEAQVNSAYKEIAKKYHPDINHDNLTPEEIEHRNELLAEANNARKTLLDYFAIEAEKAQVTPEEEEKIIKNLLIRSVREEIPQVKKLIKISNDILNPNSSRLPLYPPTMLEIETFIKMGNKYLEDHKNVLDAIENIKGVIFSNYKTSMFELKNNVADLEIIASPEAIQFLKMLNKTENQLDDYIRYCISTWNKETDKFTDDNTHKARNIVNEAKDSAAKLPAIFQKTLHSDIRIKRIEEFADEFYFLANIKSNVPDLTEEELKSIKKKPDDMSHINAIKIILENRLNVYPPQIEQAFDTLIKGWDTVDTEAINEITKLTKKAMNASIACDWFDEHTRFKIGKRTFDTRHFDEDIRQLKCLIELHTKFAKSYFLKDYKPKYAHTFKHIKEQIFDFIIENKPDLNISMEDFIEYNNSACEFLKHYKELGEDYSDPISKAGRKVTRNVYLRYAKDYVEKSKLIKSLKSSTTLTISSYVLDTQSSKFSLGLFSLLSLKCEDYATKLILNKNIFTDKKADKFIQDATKFLNESASFCQGLNGVEELSHCIDKTLSKLKLLKDVKNTQFNVNDSKNTRDFFEELIEEPFALQRQLGIYDNAFHTKFDNIFYKKWHDFIPLPAEKTFATYVLKKYPDGFVGFTEQEVDVIKNFCTTIYGWNLEKILFDELAKDNESQEINDENRASIMQKLNQFRANSNPQNLPPQNLPR